MNYNQPINEMTNGAEIEGYYVLKDAYIKNTTAGKTFLSGTISDKSGTIELKVWDYTGSVGNSDSGKVVKLRGEITEFKGALQFSASRIRLATAEDEYDVSLLVPVAPIDCEATQREIRAMVDSLSDSDYRAVCLEMLVRHEEAFKKIPAAKSVHHSFVAGLLMHTANMLKAADFLSGIYKNVIDRSLLITGTLLHDFAKEREFSFSELGVVSEYSLKGQLIGHLVMGAQEVAEIAEKTGMPEEKSILLQHLILSHHGEPDFGAAIRPACAEAELLSYIDLIDSRMEIYAESLESVPVGEFSPRIFALEKKIYHHS